MVDRISRVKRSREQARASYNRMSRFYDLLTGSSEQKFIRMGIEKLSVKPGEKVLEIGCGTGHGLLTLARLVGKQGKVYGIDISEGMLAAAQRRLEKAGVDDRVELTRCDALRLPYASNSFDAVFVSFTLELFDTPEIPKLLGECQRVQRTAGRICVVAMSKRGKHGLMMRLYEWAHQRFPNYIDCRPIYVRETIEEAGFRILEANLTIMWGQPLEIVLAGGRA